MKPGRLFYRARQFWHAVAAAPRQEDLGLAAQVLTPAQFALFHQMQPSEQVHSLEVLKKMLSSGDREAYHPDLLVAALLHDVGKTRHPLRLWERVWVVIGQAFFPALAQRWGETEAGLSSWWRRPFVVACHHSQWGAEQVAKAGSSSLTVSLIRRHQNLLPSEIVTLEERLLKTLQAADGNS